MWNPFDKWGFSSVLNYGTVKSENCAIKSDIKCSTVNETYKELRQNEGFQFT